MSGDLSEVEDFYAGKNIFITGGTGFLGKSLIEKILYSCSNISKIYVLVRDKKGKSGQERINQLFNIPAFDRLKRRPGCLLKIVALPGDIALCNLGLTDDQLVILQDEVSIVFHFAATVTFDEPLQEALKVNVDGTIEVIKLCSRMKKLQALVHVSTAYSNAERKVIDEVVYPPPHELEEARQNAKQYSDEDILERYLGGKPNTYTYSKSLAEDAMVKYRETIPTAIIRPSIVISSLNEPSPGWIDNWNGATGLFFGVPAGILKVAIGRGNNITDLVPVDIVTNLAIVAATRCESSKEVIVYNCCTGTSNPITCNEAKQIARRTALKYSMNFYPWPYLIFTSSHVLYNSLRFVLQLIPAQIADLIYNNEGVQHVKIQANLNKMVHLVKFFLLHEWNFIDKNVKSLWNSLSELDKRTFNFDVKSIDWDKCIEDYVLGARKYLGNVKSKL